MLAAEPSYADAALPVRADIERVHREAWRHIAEPGSWFSGAERVAIAAQSRAAIDCALCAERKEAASPYMVSGAHQAQGPLSAVAVDAIHRITTDPGRLSKRFYDDVLAGGLSDAQYVELLGVTLMVITVDMFCRALGVPQHPLPEPLPGEPSRHRPAVHRRIGAWVPTLDFSRLGDGPERRLAKLRFGPHVAKALSLVPREAAIILPLSAAQYVPPARTMDITYRRDRALDRSQIELLAAKVSAVQECFY